MAKVRYEQTTIGSFFGDLLYDHKVSRGNFLRKLNEVRDGNRFP